MKLDAQYCAEAPIPGGTGFVSLRISLERVGQFAGSGRLTPLFELLYNVCGIVPPVNCIGYHERDQPPFQDGWGGLKRAHTVFRGIKRPMNGDGFDRDIYIYVVSPPFSYRHIVDRVCPAKRVGAPEGTVFVAYIKFDDEEFSSGEVLNWEWVMADPNCPRYPEGHASRYDEKVWENG